MTADPASSPAPTRGIHATREHTRHLRHEEILRRWPVLTEPWAQQIEAERLQSIARARVPGQATFGR